MVTEVKWSQEHGQKSILIRSSLTIYNNTPTTLSFKFGEKYTEKEMGYQVRPYQSFHVPLWAVTRGRLSIRPNDKFAWSRKVILSGLYGVKNDISYMDQKGNKFPF